MAQIQQGDTRRSPQAYGLQGNGVGETETRAGMTVDKMPELMRGESVLSVDGSTSVLRAAERMADNNTGAVMVVGPAERLVGVFTERDLLKRVVAAGIDPARTPVREVMTRQPVTARLDDLVHDALDTMSHAPFRHLPVVDDKGRIAGLLRERDFTAYTIGQVAHRASEMAQAGISSHYQPFLILTAGVLYTAIILIVGAALL